MVLAAATLTLVAGARASAQQDSTAICNGKPVSRIDVDANRPEFRGIFAWWRKFARSLGLHHANTDTNLIRRFVTLDEGLVCTEFRRSESERILRAQPYLSDARVTASAVGDSVLVRVATVDEVPLIAGARIRAAALRAVNLGTLNFMGRGLHVEGRWEKERGLRSGFGGKIAHQQIFGRPYSLLLDGMRGSIGDHYVVSLSHPFFTDLQRIAWHTGYATSSDYARLRNPARLEILQPLERESWNVGGVLRFGPPRRLGLIGGMIVGARFEPRHEFSKIDTATGRFIPVDAADTVGAIRYPTFDATHVAGVLGLRALTFSRMGGLDALAAEQDVATGTQVAAFLGVQPWANMPLRDALASLDAYIGGRSPRNFLGARLEAESRVDLDEGAWRHAVASGRAAWYFRVNPRWTSEVSFEGAGVWRSVLPLQLELGDRRAGVRGYARAHEPGAQRLLVRIEERFDLLRVQRTRAAVGVAGFADAGRIWAGDAPYGRDTPVRTSVGAALLAAVPARSQRTLRAEIAFPTQRATGAGTEVRFTVREPTRGFWVDPPRVRWARLLSVPEQIFSWP